MLSNFFCMQKYFLAILLLLPIFAFAQGAPTTFSSFVGTITGLIQTLIVVIFALTFLVIIWTVVKTWILSGGDETEVEKGKYTVTSGVVVLVIMSGIWGILALLRRGIFGL